MNSLAPFPFHCPVCQKDLVEDENRALRCEAGHHFDRAREGYVNLLMSNQRKSAQAGDSPDMVQARRAFFAAGHYAPLEKALSQLAPDQGEILDAGCGTGHLLRTVAQQHPGTNCCGVDISKPSIKAAAKDHDKVHWVIANLMRDLPIRNQSIDCLFNVLSPRKVEEFARVLKPTGQLIMVVPGREHLAQLRERLMLNEPEEVDKVERATSACAPQFTLSDQQELAFELDLNKEAIQQLIGMTPLNWKSDRGALGDVEDLDQLNVSARFTILRFQLSSKA